MEVVTLSSILTDIGSVFTQIISWVGTVTTTIVSSPLLLIGVSIPIAGAGIGFFKRLLRV